MPSTTSGELVWFSLQTLPQQIPGDIEERVKIGKIYVISSDPHCRDMGELLKKHTEGCIPAFPPLHLSFSRQGESS